MAALSDRLAFLVSWLSRPRAHVGLTLLALALVSPALFTGLALDDYVLWLLARTDVHVPGLHPNKLFLFSFTSGHPGDNLALMDGGVLLPWFSDPHHLNAFFRPLSSLTHVLDFQLWPERPFLMHAHSLLWFGALLLVVAHVYRRLVAGSSWVCGLAFAIFALDDAHGMTASWIANRNALTAATLALPALTAHARWLQAGFAPGRYLGPLCFALGLCAGETAVAVFGYLLAYTLVLDRAPVTTRLLRLAPYLVLLALWRLTFGALGLGSGGSAAYHDPGREPLAFALALFEHLPVLLSAQLGLPLADIWFWERPELQAPIWIISIATLAGVLGLARVLLREDREARFFFVGMVLSGCVVAASVPGERLLLVPGVGGAVLIAKLLASLAERGGSAARAALLALGLLHLVAAPLSLPVRATLMGLLGAVIATADAAVPRTPDVTRETVVFLNPPFDVAVSYLQPARAALDQPRPEHLYWLASASSELRVERRDERTLRVTPARGFLLTPSERHYRADPSALGKGARVTLSQLEATVIEVTADGRPAAVDFSFHEPLESARYRLLAWRDGGVSRFDAPAPGRSVSLSRQDFFGTLARRVIGL